MLMDRKECVTMVYQLEILNFRLSSKLHDSERRNVNYAGTTLLPRKILQNGLNKNRQSMPMDRKECVTAIHQLEILNFRLPS